MKKLLLCTLALLVTAQSHAFHIHATQLGLKDTDTFSVYAKTVSGNCKIEESKYDCTSTTNKMEGIALPYFNDFFNRLNKQGDNKKLVELNIKINKKAFKNCQHIEARGQDIFLRLTPQGCL